MIAVFHFSALSSHWCCSISLFASSSVSTSTSCRCQDRSSCILGASMQRQNSLTRTQSGASVGSPTNSTNWPNDPGRQVNLSKGSKGVVRRRTKVPGVIPHPQRIMGRPV